MASSIKPQKRTNGLVTESLDDELLVYDLDRHKAHCLNRTAAAIWAECDGKTEVQGISARLRKDSKMAIDDEVVWVALRRLGKANLLRDRMTLPKEFEFGSTRRDLLKKLALVGGLSVVTIISPTAANAATGCTVGVSCKHACIGDHGDDFPCESPADRQNGKCCKSGDKICVQANSPGTNNAGTCTGAPCCTT